MAKGKVIADIVKSDLTRLMNKDMSKEDKDKLAAWLELANHRRQGRRFLGLQSAARDAARGLEYARQQRQR